MKMSYLSSLQHTYGNKTQILQKFIKSGKNICKNSEKGEDVGARIVREDHKEGDKEDFL